MIGSRRREVLSALLCALLLLVSLPLDSGAAAVYQSHILSGSDYSGQGLPYTSEELQALVAPVALYPDALLAQTVIGATYPDQILAANLWLQQNKDLTGAAMLQAVNAQPWDPSIKGLTQFPTVVSMMAQNLVWTSQLGEAYDNQQTAVMVAIQVLRAKAKAAGNLKSTPQVILATPTGDIISLQPQNPLMVYVPQFDPGTVYGGPMQTPGFTSGNAGVNGIAYGSGEPVSGSAGSDWGWSNWDCNWFQGVADYRSYPYYGNHAWRGGYYGGYVYYGNHPYHNDPTRPFSSQAGASAPAQPVTAAGSKRTFAVLGTTEPPRAVEGFNAWAREGGGWASLDDIRGWSQTDANGNLTAFSSWDSQAGPAFATGGWGDRSASYYGWSLKGGNSGWGIGGRSSGLHW
jgi:hypothetical protein